MAVRDGASFRCAWLAVHLALINLIAPLLRRAHVASFSVSVVHFLSLPLAVAIRAVVVVLSRAVCRVGH